MSCCSCEICQEETGFLTCPHVGPVCFDCWGSGIHEAMVGKLRALDSLMEWLTDGHWKRRHFKRKGVSV
jgi:hypothetical protein